QDFRFDALVMLGPPVPEPLMAGKMPLVTVGWHVDHPSVDVVRTCDESGAIQAVTHLVSLGHRRIAHLDGGSGLIAASRREAYMHAMRHQGLESDIRILPGGETQLAGQRATQKMLQDDELPTAIVAYNDDEAVAAMGVLMQHGIEVPGQVSVIGWDDSEVARLSSVDLTSIAQNPHEMARLAIERIVARVEGPGIVDREITLEPELKIRSSTASSPTVPLS
ncbi:substrate-binding domain-containing protein, partial [Kocuria rosea]|uniref:substrate-binding domain-containing protein n=1 Tax=Kocuria rosea TaxID=1275 RepID=UPI00203E5C2B|nr:substrate-binding domain-containing protein [Kocuria rosea]